MGKRLDFLDVAKGIGIILVMIGHSCGFIFGGDYITSFYMAMFFVVAGYVYRPSGKSYGENIKKRLNRILIPYFSYNALLLVYFIIKGVMSGDLEFSNVMAAVAGVFYSRNFLWVGREDNIYFFKLLNDPVWFLTAMCTASVIFYLIVDKCLEDRKKCAFICILLLASAVIMSFLPVLLPWSLDSAPLFSFFMVIGALLGKEEFFQRSHSMKQWIIMAVIIVISVVMRFVNGKVNLSVRMYGNYTVLSVLIIAFIGVAGSILGIWISKLICKIGIAEKVLAYIGKNTLSIMALHMAVFQVEDMTAGKIIGSAINNGMVYWGYAVIKIAAAVFVSIAVSSIGSLILEKKGFCRKK